MNGEITTVKATDKNLKIGLYQNVSYDENGYMDDQVGIASFFFLVCFG